MRETFVDKKFRAATLAIIDKANEIIDEYQAQGYTLTLRQIYYQFVARDLIPNTEQSYKRLGSIINDGRLAGLIDWAAIEDRTRNLEINSRWDNPHEGIEALRAQYHIDMWENQEVRVEVWIEKEALVGVIEGLCTKFDVPYFACRGYVSQSEQWRAYRRHASQQDTVILHLGDHDPSGIDMTRDNQDRLRLFGGRDNSVVKRIALNMDQIEQYKPPPNPAKITDSRFESYVNVYGGDSWELDALEPSVLETLIGEHIDKHRDADSWAQREEDLQRDLDRLDAILDDLGEIDADD